MGEGEENGSVAKGLDRGPRSAMMITPETNDALLACGGTAVRVWIVLRWHRNVHRRDSYASVRRMSRMLKVSQPTVLRALQELERHRLISRTGSRGQMTVYRFPIEESANGGVSTSKYQSAKAGVSSLSGTGNTAALEVLKSCAKTAHTSGDLNGGLNGDMNGGAAPSDAALGELLALAKARGFYGDTSLGIGALRALLTAHGPEKARVMVSTLPPGDLKDIAKQGPKAAPAPERRLPNPSCDHCKGSGMRPGPYNDYPCGCTEMARRASVR